jgi:hypothetical protein
VSAFGLWITIQDEGKGFNVQAAFDRCNDPESLLASGRGLLLMRGFSDEIFFNTHGNEVTLVLYADGVDRELPLGTATNGVVHGNLRDFRECSDSRVKYFSGHSH